MSNEKEVFEQIKKLRKEVEYTTRDFAINYIIDKFKDDEFYIPDEYQRNFIWDENHKSKFIESIILGLPIPFMFFSDTTDGRTEIIDGAQRTQTLEEFLNNDLELVNLKKLTLLNGFKYNDIPPYYQQKFNKTNIRVIVLTDETSLELRQEIFTRINTTGIKAKDSEVRRGKFMESDFMKFIKECSENILFKEVCPISTIMEKRYEGQELVIRFFAYLNNYKNFKHSVVDFMDDYTTNVKDNFSRKDMLNEFERMLKFVKKYFPYGFAKSKEAKSTPRVRFEAISVGVGLALREEPSLQVEEINWVDSEEFLKHTTTHSSNTLARVVGRIEYVKNKLLEKEKECKKL